MVGVGVADGVRRGPGVAVTRKGVAVGPGVGVAGRTGGASGVAVMITGVAVGGGVRDGTTTATVGVAGR